MINTNIDSILFKESFDVSIWKQSDKIEILQHHIKQVEIVIEKYLSRIKDDFPNLTDHSLEDHSKVLWKYADIIIGKKEKYLNPCEAFVLHLAFLIHDAGMCYSILKDKKEIEEDTLYTDFISSYGDTESKKFDALFYTVRQRHGDFALKIGTDKLKDGDYLIADIKLREEFGLIIGKIAKSHTCSINYIDREFSAPYSSPHFSSDWSVDCQKLSFILRLSDAAHVDNRRTPKSLRMISEIQGESREHWTFQKKLGFPILSEDNQLVYNSNSPFSIAEKKAWWFCVDALQVLDKELRDANEYFDTKRQLGFSAKGVKSINNTLELGTKYVRTDGWKSIDTKIKVTNPVHIASELGGIRLYGAINFALREIVQNSLDAINLYRYHTKQHNKNVGEIKISIEKEGDGIYLAVCDNGIGMSQTLMTNELLDFGGSYWRSSSFTSEFTGLKTQGFEAIGKFGIGFFSVFMLGEKVTVTSWKFGEGIDKMKTIDFHDGLLSHPILREASSSEKNRIIDRGTLVKIKLTKDPYSKEGFVGISQHHSNTLYSLTKYFIPSPDVKISITELGGKVNVIEPDAIETMSYSEVLDHVCLFNKNDLQMNQINLYKQFDQKFIDVLDETRFYGRLGLIPNLGQQLPSTAITISKGIRINDLGGFVGYILTDDIISIKRDAFSKIVPLKTLKVWATKQIEYIKNAGPNVQQLFQNSYYGLALAFNLFDDSFPIAYSKTDRKYFYVSIKQFKAMLGTKSEIKFYSEGHNPLTTPDNCELLHLRLSSGIEQIIRNEDLSEIVKYNELVERIIREVWGDFLFEEENFLQKGNYSFDMPYFLIQTYSKKSI